MNLETKVVDISRHNGKVDFNKMKDQDVELVYIRTSVGDYYKDEKREENYEGAKSAGIKVGFYHPIAPALDGIFITGEANFENFMTAMGDMVPDVYPVWDCELVREVSKQKLTNVIKRCVDLGNDVFGRSFIYTRGEWWRNYVERRDYWQELTDLIIARYNQYIPHPWADDYKCDPIDWDTWSLWQYSEKGDGPAYGCESKAIDLHWINPEYTIKYLTDNGDDNVNDLDTIVEQYNYLMTKGIQPLVILTTGAAVVIPDPIPDPEPPDPNPDPTPDPTPDPDLFGEVKVTTEKALAHWIVGENSQGNPILKIYPSDTSATKDRVRFEQGEKVLVYKGLIKKDQVDGHDGFYKIAEDCYTQGSVFVPETLYLKQSEVMKTW